MDGDSRDVISFFSDRDSGLSQRKTAPVPLDRHIRTPALKRLYLQWQNRAADGHPPTIEHFDFDRDNLAAHRFIAAVVPDGFRFIHVGQALVARLGRSPVGEFVADDGAEPFGSLQASYRNCAAQQTPTYEFVRYALGDGRPLLFERLIMPFHDEDGALTHLGGVALFTELAATH